MMNKLKGLLAASTLLCATTVGVGSAAAAGKSVKPRQVQVSVTSNGFEPAEIKTRKGEPLRLVITRTTDRTCATEVVIKDLGITRKLPLNEAVAVELTPKKDGQLRYACGMDMISGVIVVE